MKDIVSKSRRFLHDTLGELRKCTWPGRSELFESTLLVLVSIVLLGLFVAAVDYVSRLVIALLTTGTI